ncbi:hypothetical protein BJ508DRAFT_333561 [Ascobolus immersus RN42]|uniref:F-box domain-containing protein n=1 Tax=Ascobolus immersus RN42 TaxID=1160509 RepID=A0A3N4HJ87_ASCIM|nr:hypothetical protein BJ508DRAFT_333561 [Ascobolus immersus RN42]
MPETHNVEQKRLLTMSDPQTSALSFLKLPLEMRLAIYENCTVFSLFLLTQTCRTLYTDINNRTHLVKRSKGYSANLKYFPERKTTNRHPILPAGIWPLTIPMMSGLDTLETDTHIQADPKPGRHVMPEALTFNKLYSRFYCRRSDEHWKKRWWCCEHPRCGVIKRRGVVSVSERDWSRPAWWDNRYCRPCNFKEYYKRCES